MRISEYEANTTVVGLIDLAADLVEILIPERNGFWWENLEKVKKTKELPLTEVDAAFRPLVHRALKMKWATICRYDPRDRKNEITWIELSREASTLIPNCLSLCKRSYPNLGLFLQVALGAALGAHTSTRRQLKYQLGA